MSSGISQADFEFISQLVMAEAAIVIDKGKEYLVESRINPVAKSLGYAGIPALVEKLRQSKCKDLCRKVVESLTTHETSFFRDNEPFEVLRKYVIPQLIEEQRKYKELTIWCGAASSGQEPYSLAMLLRENFPELNSWKLKYIATDISSAILDKAKKGKFSQIEVNRGLPVKLLMKYFEKESQEWIIKPELRNMIEFKEQNLLHPYISLPQCDLVMLRNVLIYFDLEIKKQILEKIRRVLKPTGFLFLGTAETTINIDNNFDRVAFEKTSCYKKKA